MQIAQALRQTTKPFVSLEFFPPAAESHLPEFYETVERLRSIDPLFLSVTYGATSPKGRGLGKEMDFAWTAKGSHFEERLPPAGGRCRAATKRGIWRTNVSLRGRAR